MDDSHELQEVGPDTRSAPDCKKVWKSLRLTHRQAMVLDRLATLNGESQSATLRRVLTQGLLAELGADVASFRDRIQCK